MKRKRKPAVAGYIVDMGIHISLVWQVISITRVYELLHSTCVTGHADFQC
jgi:hypothetical protein